MTDQTRPVQSQSKQGKEGVEQRYSEQDAIGAIRLAMEAGADARTRSAVIREILRRAPLTDRANVSSVNLLIRAVQAAKAEFRVTDQEPKGRFVRPAKQGEGRA